MAVNDSDKKSRAISEKRVEKGKEFQQLQEAQGQLLNIQAEQRNNLNEERVISNMEAQNNQTLAQAAGLMAAGGIGAVAGGIAASNIQKFNPNTQAILSKFGIGKPGTQSKTTHTVQQNPQKINITNNTTTTNNNNIQLSQPPIPVAAPAIQMRAAQQQGSDVNKFKVWISNAFAKQNEAAAIREKEYRRREWTLTRSANKMIRKMGEIGKSIGETISPRNVGNLLGDQLKVILTLMGLHLIAKNIHTILDGVNDVVGYFTGKYREIKDKSGNIKVKEPKFVTDIKDTLVALVGGEKGETFFDALKGLFGDLVGRLSGEMKLLFDSRARAIKELKFPEIDLKTMGTPGIIAAIGGYLGDVLSVALGGQEALAKTKINEITRKAKKDSLESYEDKYSHTQDADHILGGTSGYRRNDTSIGDAVMYDKGFKKNFKMAASDYNPLGGLANNVGSSVKQSQFLTNQLYEMTRTGNINVGIIASGFNLLKKSAGKGDGTLVSGDYLDSLGIALGISDVMDYVKSSLKLVRVRYIIVPKTEYELQNENAGSFVGSTVDSYLKNRLLTKTAGGGVRWLGSSGISFHEGNWVEGISKVALGWVGSKTTAAIEGTASSIRGLSHDDYTIKMVREDDIRYPYNKYPSAQGKDGYPLVDENNNLYYLLTKKAINYIEDSVKARTNEKFSMDAENAETLTTLDKLLVDYVNKSSPGTRAISGLGEYDETLRTIEYLNSVNKAEREQFKRSIEGDRVSNIGYIASGNRRRDMEYIGAANEIELKRSKPITNEEIKKNALYIMKRLMEDPDLALSESQASGIVGNLMTESNLNPKARNSSGASGIAQWLGDRKMLFEKGEAYAKSKKPGSNVVEELRDEEGNLISKWVPKNKDITEATLEEQVDFLIHELKTSHSKAIERLKDKGENISASDSADIGLHSFEFSKGSLEGVEKEFAKHGQKGQAAIESRRQNAINVLGLYYDTFSNRVKEIKERFRKDKDNPYKTILGKFAPTQVAYDTLQQKKETFKTNPENFIQFDENGNLKKILNPLSDDRTTAEKALEVLSKDEQNWFNALSGLSGPDQFNGLLRDMGIKKINIPLLKGTGKEDVVEYWTEIIRDRKYTKWPKGEQEKLAKILGLKDLRALDDFSTKLVNSGVNAFYFLDDDAKMRLISQLFKTDATLKNPLKTTSTIYADSGDGKIITSTSDITKSGFDNEYDSRALAYVKNNWSEWSRYINARSHKEMPEIVEFRTKEKQDKTLDQIKATIKDELVAKEQNRIFEDFLKTAIVDETGKPLDKIKDDKGNYNLKPLRNIIDSITDEQVGIAIQELESGENKKTNWALSDFESGTYNLKKKEKEISNVHKLIAKYGGKDHIMHFFENQNTPEARKFLRELAVARYFDDMKIYGDTTEELYRLNTERNFTDTLLNSDRSGLNEVLLQSAGDAYNNLSKEEKERVGAELLEGIKKYGNLSWVDENDISLSRVVKGLKNSTTFKNVQIESKRQQAYETSNTMLLPEAITSGINGIGLANLSGLDPSKIESQAESIVDKLKSTKYLDLNGAKLLSTSYKDSIEKKTDSVSLSKDSLKTELNMLDVLSTMAHNDIITGYYNQIATQALIALTKKNNVTVTIPSPTNLSNGGSTVSSETTQG